MRQLSLPVLNKSRNKDNKETGGSLYAKQIPRYIQPSLKLRRTLGITEQNPSIQFFSKITRDVLLDTT